MALAAKEAFAMKRLILLVWLALLVSACAGTPYEHTYGIPTIASTAAGAAIGASMGGRHHSGQNAVIGGVVGAMVGTAAEYTIDNAYRRDQAQQQYYQQSQYYQPQQGYYQQPNYTPQPGYAPQYNQGATGYYQNGQWVPCRPGYNCPQTYYNRSY
jgi:hypothetical protein